MMRVLCATLVALLWLSGPVARAADDDVRGELKQLKDEVRALEQRLRDLERAQQPRRTSNGWEAFEGPTIRPEGAPRRGQASAPYALIEFSDYQCPYCARHFAETMPQIERELIGSGKVQYFVSEFPLERLHPLALKAAQAARCAGDQDRFWEMHARLFTNQRALEPFEGHAQALGLDGEKFGACMGDAQRTAEVRRNTTEAAKAGIASTPTFLLAQVTPEGLKVIRRLRGAAPFGAFKAEIESLSKTE